MKIIGLSGKMKSGKTTVAEYLERELDCDVLVYGFADSVRVLMYEFFGEVGRTMDDYKSQSVKEEKHVSGKTNRQMLQEIGRKMREIWPDVWIHNWREWVKGYECTVIVPDVRFPNEVKAIQDLGGIVIRLTRDPVDSDDETETALDDVQRLHGLSYCEYGRPYKFDHLIDNATMSIDETNEAVLKIVKEYLA